MSSFDWQKMYKWEHNLDYEINTQALEYVLEHYGVDDIGDLTVQQISDIEHFTNQPEHEHSMMCRGLREVIHGWHDQNS